MLKLEVNISPRSTVVIDIDDLNDAEPGKVYVTCTKPNRRYEGYLVQVPKDRDSHWLFAAETAKRIVDESDFRKNKDTAELLEYVLTEAFRRSPDLLDRLIGTEVIEEDFFADLK